LTNEETLRERMTQKNLDGIEQRGLKYLLQVQTHMLKSVKRLKIEYLLIDATEDIESIHRQITAFLHL